MRLKEHIYFYIISNKLIKQKKYLNNNHIIEIDNLTNLIYVIESKQNYHSELQIYKNIINYNDEEYSKSLIIKLFINYVNTLKYTFSMFRLIATLHLTNFNKKDYKELYYFINYSSINHIKFIINECIYNYVKNNYNNNKNILDTLLYFLNIKNKNISYLYKDNTKYIESYMKPILLKYKSKFINENDINFLNFLDF